VGNQSEREEVVNATDSQQDDLNAAGTSKNTSSIDHPEIYTHDGETYLQQVFDYYLN